MRFNRVTQLLSVAVLTLWACGDSGTEPTNTMTVTAGVVPPPPGLGGAWIPNDPRFRGAVEKALADYKPDDHIRWLSDGYSPTGQYLNFWHQKWGESATLRFDSEGVPQVAYDGVFIDHPVTLCRYALHLHGRIVRGESDLTPQFLRVVERLLATQDQRGVFAYPFEYRLYGHRFAPGWPSAMAQGMGLSVLRRAYEINKDRRYLLAGNRAAYFLNIPRENGGVKTTLAELDPSLSNYLWLEEFATVPANYKLNGFMFTLLGLYDWWQRNPAYMEGSTHLSGQLFQAGIRTLEVALRYADVQGFTATDFRYIVVPGTMPNVSPAYHRVHIYQLHTLSEITGNPILKYYENLWRWYVEH